MDPRNNNQYVADGEKEESKVTLSVSKLGRLISQFKKLNLKTSTNSQYSHLTMECLIHGYLGESYHIIAVILALVDLIERIWYLINGT